MNVVIGALSDIGTHKAVNQDAAAAAVSHSGIGRSAFAIVCDGVGSYSKSEMASSYAVNRFINWFCEDYRRIADIADEESFCSDLYECWHNMLYGINAEIYSYYEKYGSKLGTTLSCLLVRNGKFYIFHVGDTRIYSLDEGVKCLTVDHTVAQKEIDSGIATPEQMANDRKRHILTKCVGSRERVKPDFYSGDTAGNVKYLLCSDGFRDRIGEDRLYERLYKNKPVKKKKLEKAIEEVISSVKKAGEKDNITAIIVQISEDNKK